MKRRSTMAVLVASLLGSACTQDVGEHDDGAWVGTTTTEGDVTTMMLARKERNAYAEVKGFSRDLTVEESDWVWLGIPIPDFATYYRGSPLMADQRAYRVLDPDGRYVGVTQWPEGARSAGYVMRGPLLVLGPDPQTDKTIPTVYRIHPLPESLAYP